MIDPCISCWLGQLYEVEDVTGTTVPWDKPYDLSELVSSRIDVTAGWNGRRNGIGSSRCTIRFIRTDDEKQYDVAPYIKKIEELGFTVKKIIHTHE